MTALDAEDIFAQSVRFHRSSSILTAYTYQWAKFKSTPEPDNGFSGSIDNAPPTMIVSFVCRALAGELLLKSILLLSGQAVPKKHELDFLYNIIPQTWKDRIAEEYKTEITKPIFVKYLSSSGSPKSLEENLKMSADAFVRWRYFYEGNPPSSFISPALNAIAKAILQVKPEWASHWKDFDIPLQHLPLSARALADEPR